MKVKRHKASIATITRMMTRVRTGKPDFVFPFLLLLAFAGLAGFEPNGSALIEDKKERPRRRKVENMFEYGGYGIGT